MLTQLYLTECCPRSLRKVCIYIEDIMVFPYFFVSLTRYFEKSCYWKMFHQVFARKTESIRANNMDIDIPKFKSSIHLIFYLNSLVTDV